MATENHNLSEYNKENVPNGADFKIGIVVSEWNPEITLKLLEGAKKTFIEHGVEERHIVIRFVPGAYELPLASQLLFENSFVDGIIAIGSVIQGETKHFDFICSSVAHGITDVNLKYKKPVSFCVLTDNTLQQALDRSGGKHGNKGIECAVACLKMIGLTKSF
jgi:6,7-dimethyl-8-ribityllumazine synthase